MPIGEAFRGSPVAEPTALRPVVMGTPMPLPPTIAVLGEAEVPRVVGDAGNITTGGTPWPWPPTIMGDPSDGEPGTWTCIDWAWCPGCREW